MKVGIPPTGLLQAALQRPAGEAEAAGNAVDGGTGPIHPEFDQVRNAGRKVLADRLVLSRMRLGRIEAFRVLGIERVGGKHQAGPSSQNNLAAEQRLDLGTAGQARTGHHGSLRPPCGAEEMAHRTEQVAKREDFVRLTPTVDPLGHGVAVERTPILPVQSCPGRGLKEERGDDFDSCEGGPERVGRLNLLADRTQTGDPGAHGEPGWEGRVADLAHRGIDEPELVAQQDQAVGRVEERERYLGPPKDARDRATRRRDGLGDRSHGACPGQAMCRHERPPAAGSVQWHRMARASAAIRVNLDLPAGHSRGGTFSVVLCVGKDRTYQEHAMARLAFDDRNIVWRTVEGFDHAAYHILSVDEDARIVDLLFKFAANERIALHRHAAAYRTLVLQGELRIYRPNGELKEVRPVGSYVAGKAGGEPHTEGGGDQDVIVYFTNRDIDGPVYEILDEHHRVVAIFGIPEFKALYEAQSSCAA